MFSLIKTGRQTAPGTGWYETPGCDGGGRNGVEAASDPIEILLIALAMTTSHDSGCHHR